MMTKNNLILARQVLLEPAGLTENQLQTVLSQLLSPAVDMADLYFQATQSESWVLEDRIIKNGSFNIERGVGVRAISGEKTGFAYSDDIILPALQSAAKMAASIAGRGQHGHMNAWQKKPLVNPLYQPIDPILSLNEREKLDLLRQVDEAARAMDPRVQQVNVSLVGEQETILVFNSDGSMSADIRPLVRLNVSVIAEEKGQREQGFAGGGGRTDYHYFMRDNIAIDLAKEAVRQAILNLEAVPAPAGTMPVVLGPGWPGVLLHEAVGHGLEGDFNRKGSSAFTGRVGQRVASPGCTVVDDGTLPNRRGSLTIDDEGTPTQRTILIEKGILKGYMQDKLNARLMGTQSTGNGRRESYACLPMPRMTNTYMLPGPYAPEEIIASVDKGLYAVNFSGGQVDITSGKFVFSACEAYLIENGRITRPVKGATLIGNGPEVLNQVSMIGNDLKLDSGIGSCGKEGQSVPVGVGQPTLKIDSLTVGGTAT
ncbi:TldD protein [Candidatus Rickettsiella viridis]|uniref:TldD protein n=2 Tax=Candidatus Rickettsiella viridis TaxID=676208 RepID=A0A2Z5V3K4_9COXI|nr:TldD protein [Candidatus Rickettsiella viridis]